MLMKGLRRRARMAGCDFVVAGGLLFSGAVMPSAVQAAPVNLQVTGGDVRSVLLAAARLGGINLVMDGSVQGTVTVSLQAEPLEVLRKITEAHGLALVPACEQTYLIIPAASDTSLRQVHVWTVRYADPHELAAALNLSLGGQEKRLTVANKETINKQAKETSDESGEAVVKTVEAKAELPGPGRVLVNEATNDLVYYGTAAEAARAEALARQLDVPAKQVKLEARVVALTQDASRALGTELGDTENGTITFRHELEGGPMRGSFAVKLHELIGRGQAKLLSRPNVTTVQGHEALINIGDEVPVPVSHSTYRETTNSYKYRKVGIILRCLPRVSADGWITTDVHTEVSSPEYVPDLKVYRFHNRSADTRVRLRDGETMVIGGLIGQEDSHALSRIPFLSKIPILGGFFTYAHNSRKKSEIMIFLQAHVLTDKEGGAADATQRSR